MLVVEFHSNGVPFIFTAQDHKEFVDAFYQISQDRASNMAILAGAGGELIPEIELSSFGNVGDAAVWSQVYDEGVQILENVVNIRVPVIAAIEGRAHVQNSQRSAMRSFSGCTSGAFRYAESRLWRKPLARGAFR